MNLTIITVNLNNAFGLQRTIESVISQSFTDFEYIIIDGLSNDGSEDVIKLFDNKITKWISEPDTGVYQAMNKGIRLASGNYLLFLNSGDFLVSKDAIMEVFSTGSTADILCARCNISLNGQVVHITDPPSYITFGDLYNQGLSHQSTFIKRDLFYKLGFYREDFKYNSDIEFWYRSIIFGGATTDKIKVIVSDYNLDGISSKQNTSNEFKKEHEIILSHPTIKRIVPDYIKWSLVEKDWKILYWVQNKKYLLLLLKLIFKINQYLKLN